MRRPKVWRTPGGPKYPFLEKVLQEPSVIIGGGYASGKTELLRALIYTALYKAPVGAEDGAAFVLLDEASFGLLEFAKLPHTLRFETEKENIMDALERVFALADYRLKQATKLGMIDCSEMGEVYVFIDNLHWAILDYKSKIVNLLMRICLRSRQSHVHVIATSLMAGQRKIIPEELMCSFSGRIALRCDNAKESRRIIDKSGAEKLEVGELYFMGMRDSLTHYVGVPMIPQEEIDNRVSFWMEQIENKIKWKFWKNLKKQN